MVKKMTTGSLQIRNKKYQMVINVKDELGRRKQIWKSTGLKAEKKNKKNAEEMLWKLRSKYHNDGTLNFSKILFCDFLRDWLEIKKDEIQITTYDGYKSMLECHLYPFFIEADLKLANLEAKDIKRYYQFKIQNGLSGNTLIKHHRIIRTALKYAVEQGIISSNCSDIVKAPKVKKYQPDFYSTKEVLQLIEAIKGSSIEFPVLMAIIYGLRRSEILGLKWEAIDWDNEIINIRNKVVRSIDSQGKLISVEDSRMKSESSRRSFPFCEDIKSLLHELKQTQEKRKNMLGDAYNRSNNEFLFVNELGDQYRPDYITHTFEKFLAKNGLKHVRFHDLRHACATLLVREGTSMKYVSEYLGHSNITTTMDYYAHVAVADKIQLTNTIQNTISQNPIEAR